MKRTAVFLLFFTLSSSLWAFEGAWGLYTEIVQVIYRGRVLGFAEPEEANKVSLVHFIDGEKAELVYAGEKYEATYLQEGNALIFESSEFSPPLVITMLEVRAARISSITSERWSSSARKRKIINRQREHNGR